MLSTVIFKLSILRRKRKAKVKRGLAERESQKRYVLLLGSLSLFNTRLEFVLFLLRSLGLSGGANLGQMSACASMLLLLLWSLLLLLIVSLFRFGVVGVVFLLGIVAASGSVFVLLVLVRFLLLGLVACLGLLRWRRNRVRTLISNQDNVSEAIF